MKKIVSLLLLSLVLVMGIGSNVYALDGNEMHIQVVPVTAVKSSASGKYRREINNQSNVIKVYNDSITLSDICNVYASDEENASVQNAGYTLTFRTNITPNTYAEEVEKTPELSKYNSDFDYVMSFDMVMSKVLSSDSEGKNVLSYFIIDETPKPVGIQMGLSAFDPDEKTVDKCIMVIFHNGTLKTLPVVYDEESATFVFATYEFSEYFLYYTLKDKKQVTPTPTPTPIPTPTPTPTPTPDPDPNPTPDPKPTPTPTPDPIPDPDPNPTPTPDPTPTPNPGPDPTPGPTPDPTPTPTPGPSPSPTPKPTPVPQKRDDTRHEHGKDVTDKRVYDNSGVYTRASLFDNNAETWRLFNMMIAAIEAQSAAYQQRAVAAGPVSEPKKPISTNNNTNKSDKKEDKPAVSENEADTEKKEVSVNKVTPTPTPTPKATSKPQQSVSAPTPTPTVAPTLPEKGADEITDVNEPKKDNTLLIVVSVIAGIGVIGVVGYVLYKKKKG